jgi:hypothetical protein
MRKTLLLILPLAFACRGGPVVEEGEVISTGLSTPPCVDAPPDLDGEAQDALGGEGVPFDQPEHWDSGWDSGGWDSGGWDTGQSGGEPGGESGEEPGDDPGDGPGATGGDGQGDGGPPGGGPN